MEKDKEGASEAWRTIMIIPLVMNSGCFLFFFSPLFFFPLEIFFFAEREGEEMEWNVDWEGTTSAITPRPALSAASRGHINLIQKK